MKLFRALPVAGLLAATACASGGASSTAGSDAMPSAAGAGSGTAMIATLTPTGTRLSGTVRLSPAARAGQTRAVVAIRNGPGDSELGWQIRQGQCGERGPQIGPQAAYQAIRTRGDGSGEITVTLPIALPSGNAYHVNILSSRTDDAVLACGGFSEASG